MSKEPGGVICFGEVLWDMLPSGKKIGGAPLNVAYHLHKHGINSILVSRIGNDEYGEEIKTFLNQKGLTHTGVQTDLLYPTGKVGVQFHPNHEVSYEIFNNAAWDFIEFNDVLTSLVSKTKYIVFGSLIMRNPVSCHTLLYLLNNIPFKIFDLNLRKPFYSEKTIQELLEKADIVKMNKAELELVSGWFNAKGNLQCKMESLYNRFHLNTLVVTNGGNGACAIREGKYLFKQSYKVAVVDTVGSGDAFLAGFLSEYFKDSSLQQSLETANKMGALIAQKQGGCPEYTLGELNNITNS